MSYAEYLAAEADSPVRHEYVGGELFAMAGGTRAHGLVQTALVAALLARLRNTRCRPTGPDNRVYFPAYGESAYPDAHVVCGRTEFHPADPDAVTNPVFVAEVLSPSTERWDRGGKFERYESLPSVREIALVDPERRRIELFRRNADATFTRHVYTEEQSLVLESIDATIPLAEIYALMEAERAEA